MTMADYEHYNKMSLKELLDAGKDVFNAIQNEKIWALGAHDDEDACMHYQNVENLREELKYINELIKYEEEQHV